MCNAIKLSYRNVKAHDGDKRIIMAAAAAAAAAARL